MDAVNARPLPGRDQTRRPRVVHLTCVHSAADRRIYAKECRSLADAGFIVSLVAPRRRADLCDDPRIRLVLLPEWRHRVIRRTVGATLTWLAAFRQKADLYHAHDPELLPGAAVAALLGKTVVFDAHEDLICDFRDRMLLRLPGLMRTLARRIFDKLYRRLTSRAAAVVAATEPIAASVGHHRSIVVHNFPLWSCVATAPASGEREKCVIYAGGINRHRGLIEMIQAVGLLPQQLNATLVIAGPWENPEDEKYASGLAGWSRVRYVGVLSPAAISDLFSRVRAGLVLFHPLANHIESMPTKLFEYMAAGLPVVASAFDYWRPFVETHRAGLLVNPLDPPAIAAALEWLLTHPAEADQMGARGREAVRHCYSWQAEAEKLTGLYRELLPSCFSSEPIRTAGVI